MKRLDRDVAQHLRKTESFMPTRMGRSRSSQCNKSHRRHRRSYCNHLFFYLSNSQKHLDLRFVCGRRVAGTERSGHDPYRITKGSAIGSVEVLSQTVFGLV